MDNFFKFQCDVESTNYESNILLEIVVDNTKFFDSKVREPRHIEYEISNADYEHELKFFLSNKTDNDTIVDEKGSIVQDSTIIIKNIMFNGINIDNKFSELSVYFHDQNAHGIWHNDKFYGSLSYNGRVSLKFTTPIDQWIFKNI